MKWIKTEGIPILGNHHMMIYAEGFVFMVFDHHGFYYEGVALMDFEICQYHVAKCDPVIINRHLSSCSMLYPQTYPHSEINYKK